MDRIDPSANHRCCQGGIDPDPEVADVIGNTLSEWKRGLRTGEIDEAKERRGDNAKLESGFPAEIVDIGKQRHDRQEQVGNPRIGIARNIKNEAENDGKGQKGDFRQDHCSVDPVGFDQQPTQSCKASHCQVSVSQWPVS